MCSQAIILTENIKHLLLSAEWHVEMGRVCVTVYLPQSPNRFFELERYPSECEIAHMRDHYVDLAMLI
jgi:hypothetical protein